jgi:hypothetical protein
MTYFAQFAKLLTGEVCVVLSTDPKKRQATLGTHRLGKKGGYETLSMYADALVFTEGSVHTALCTGTQKDPCGMVIGSIPKMGRGCLSTKPSPL